jgi:uncharacterized iron-regulated membrane protein
MLSHAEPRPVASESTAPRGSATPVVDLLSVLQATLALVDQRAMNLTALLLASLVALWTQLHAFAAGVPAVLAWLAWSLLVVALLVMARVMLPHRLVKLGDSVFGSKELPCRFGPEEEMEILAGASYAVRDEIEWLRIHILASVALGVLALADAVVAYVIQKA